MAVRAREEWVALADRLVEAALARLTLDGTAISLPGAVSRNGARSDALEGFARVFQLYAFAVASGSSRLGDEARDAFLHGVSAGTLGSAWPAPDEGNAPVNLAAIALGLRILGPDFWARLDGDAQERLVDCFDRAILQDTPDNNWVLFRLPMRSFLASIGRAEPAHDAAVTAALARLDAWYEPESGWYSDGNADSYDYYNAFELHFLPPLIAHLDGDESLPRYAARLERFLGTYSLLFDASGRPVYVGRSLPYRFAVAAPFAISALVGGSRPEWAGERAAAILSSFVERGAPGSDGLLELGWYGPEPSLAQGYSAPGAAYFAGKAFVALLLASEHPFWTPAPPSVPAPGVTAVGGTGLLVETVPGGRLVRLVNHGINERHATTIAKRYDEPLYSRLGYSTMTAPVEAGDLMDRSFVLSAAEPYSRGRIEHVAHGRDWASSRSHPRRRSDEPIPAQPQWIRGKDLKNHTVHLLTVARGGWQLDVCVVPAPLPSIETASYGGWAVPDGVPISDSLVRSGQLEAEVVGLHGFDVSGVAAATTPQPFAATAALPYLRATAPRAEHNRLVLVAASRLDPVGTPRRRPPRVMRRLSRLLRWRRIVLRFGPRIAIVRLGADGLELRG